MRDEYLPEVAIIEEIVEESSEMKTFTLRLAEKGNGIFRYRPGQFMMLSVPGYGEAAFTFASLPTRERRFQVSVRKVGSLTTALHRLGVRDRVGIRGPYGNSFPLEKMRGKDLLFVAGGCGMAPLRPALQHVLKQRKEYGRIEVVYGCKTPHDIAYKGEVRIWLDQPDTKVMLTVDTPDETWEGASGVVTLLLPQIKLNPKTAVALLCGPSVMIRFAARDLLKMGFREKSLYASLERYMKCGIGKCGHCYIKGKYACLDGPNFSYSQMKGLGIES